MEKDIPFLTNNHYLNFHDRIRDLLAEQVTIAEDRCLLKEIMLSIDEKEENYDELDDLTEFYNELAEKSNRLNEELEFLNGLTGEAGN